MKAVNKDELETLLCATLGFPNSAFSPKPKHKMAQFATALLQEMETDWHTFTTLSDAEKQAAAELSDFPPPNGAQMFFNTAVTRILVYIVGLWRRCV